MEHTSPPHHPENISGTADDGEEGTDLAAFDPVPTKQRHDGWSAERQIAFIEALAELGCVERAARCVGMSAGGAYRLRRRADAQAFRLAWDAALDHATSRLSHAALSRAIHGTTRPIFYKGDQVGEWQHYDEKLTMFLLRLRDPVRYGKWREGREAVQHRDGPALVLGRWFNRLSDWLYDRESYSPGNPDEPMIGHEGEGDDPDGEADGEADNMGKGGNA